MKKYQKPSMEVTKFEAEDIMATSGKTLPVADVTSPGLTIDYKEHPEWSLFE